MANINNFTRRRGKIIWSKGLQYSTSGTAYYAFHIETDADDYSKYPEKASCIAFGELAEKLGEYGDGDFIAIEGASRGNADRRFKDENGKHPYVEQVVVQKILDDEDFTADLPF